MNLRLRKRHVFKGSTILLTGSRSSWTYPDQRGCYKIAAHHAAVFYIQLHPRNRIGTYYYSDQPSDQHRRHYPFDHPQDQINVSLVDRKHRIAPRKPFNAAQ